MCECSTRGLVDCSCMHTRQLALIIVSVPCGLRDCDHYQSALDHSKWGGYSWVVLGAHDGRGLLPVQDVIKSMKIKLCV